MYFDIQIGAKRFEISCEYYLIIKLDLKVCKFKGQNNTKDFAVTLHLHFIYRMNRGSREFENCIELHSAIKSGKTLKMLFRFLSPTCELYRLSCNESRETWYLIVFIPLHLPEFLKNNLHVIKTFTMSVQMSHGEGVHQESVRESRSQSSEAPSTQPKNIHYSPEPIVQWHCRWHSVLRKEKLILGFPFFILPVADLAWATVQFLWLHTFLLAIVSVFMSENQKPIHFVYLSSSWCERWRGFWTYCLVEHQAGGSGSPENK